MEKDVDAFTFAFFEIMLTVLAISGLVVLHAVDFLTTKYLLAHGGIELNPEARLDYEMYGLHKLIEDKAQIAAFNTLLLLTAVILIWIGRKTGSLLIRAIAIILLMWFAAYFFATILAVLNNLAALVDV